jgi:hypothetical protein
MMEIAKARHKRDGTGVSCHRVFLSRDEGSQAQYGHNKAQNPTHQVPPGITPGLKQASELNTTGLAKAYARPASVCKPCGRRSALNSQQDDP